MPINLRVLTIRSCLNYIFRGFKSAPAQHNIIANTIITPVKEDYNPIEWSEHRYGLTTERWQSLKGKSFWITGAGTGYGRSLSCALAAAGAQVFLTGRRLAKIEESIKEIESMGISASKCVILPVDISIENNILEACEKVKSLCPALNGLVNNAAVPPNGRAFESKPLQEEPLATWEQMMKVNVTATWLITRNIFPHMRQSRHPRVLFITSEAGWASTTGVGIYNISKCTLNSLTHSMAEEYAWSYPKEDIQLNALNPGESRTEMNRNSKNSPYAVVSMALLLLSHPEGGPNGRFFARDGRHIAFGYTGAWDKPLI